MEMQLLPLEIQCEIFSYPMTLQEFLTLRKQSLETKELVEACIEHLVPGKEGYLFPDLVLDLERIKTISSDYPIYISNKEQLLILAKHPTLREATFDLTDLANLEGNIFAFFSKYKTFGNTCQDCQERYNFTFLIRDHHFIQITEGSIKTHDIPPLNKLFLKNIITKVPICEYTGVLDKTLFFLDELPCLNKISLIFNKKIFQEMIRFSGELIFADKIKPKIQNIREFYISYPKVTNQNISYDLLIESLVEPSNRKNIMATTFFPIPFKLETIRNLKKFMPNLTSIWFTLSGLNSYLEYSHAYYIGNFIREIRNYSEIVLFNDLIKPREKQFYLNIFPTNLHNKIIFVESDWLI